ncbi:ENT3 (YJR125C) [Zygosaccharomyces parabailii]|uniref:ZYBA0S11-03862g1_1 n=1 Tax=Zygosaccharomyces bailii (strain CLIB 213 / ATCC 58445 / CBS 680 / BCRC 21525 / NBRC 1098 / NCYC 1416 / NRRL Y-2227) TaxID=1333698 RepID=A0A8J2XAB1_ZYGB2|nr:ENT3 (YJR125C) [Zygosaccharomyces parabailii]CDF91483.1 ZYBA0S11-03862g1_1 [Zygosaccharomyces bailii CLIB 213]CDH17092.1 related to Epsin-3 [Zygosaccharomyces bailii ISA1307]SJM86707.1 related to Epsin-3 [Zygosaccharomyces bailii]
MSIEESLANVSLYDAKKYFRKAQNVVFNYTEMEAKVREATNNEPWGASSTLMEYIAQGTYNLREREEILGMIFRRFTEKTAGEWRQIYKALQLLDYLVKHGSERFIDDTRCSLSLIKMLESFHYVDSQGKDQGVNVRSRAKALTELLGDDERIRSERKKARETSKKYKGVAGGSAGPTVPPANFMPNKPKGISISADYDTEEEEISETDEVAEFNDVPQNGNLISHQESSDETVEFGEFQCAPPVKRENSAASNDVFGTFTSNAAPTAPVPSSASVFPIHNVVPAIAKEPKKVDPFSSLFSNAMQSAEPLRPTRIATAESKAEPKKEEQESITPDEDTAFGELKAAESDQKQLKEESNAAAEVDLLSF